MKRNPIETIQTLIATKNQTDYSIIRKMNITTDCIMANSTEDNISTGETVIEGNNVLVLNTTAKSIGAVRNIALDNATADCVLFADDNVVYTDDVKEKIIDAFNCFKSADVIIFSSEESDGQTTLISQRAEKRHFFNTLKYPTYIIAARRESLKRKKIHFSELFGEGCHYQIGNDTKFLADCFKKGLNVYSHCYKIASKYFEETENTLPNTEQNVDATSEVEAIDTVKEQVSKLFENPADNTQEQAEFQNGIYNKKFFFDKGALYSCIFGPFAFFAINHFAKKYCTECGEDENAIKAAMLKGAQDYLTKKDDNKFNKWGR